MVTVIWDDADDPDGNTAHVAEHGLTPDEVDEILLDDILPTAFSQSSGRPCRFGWTSTGRHIIVIWEEVNDDPRMVYPVTAYEVPEPGPSEESAMGKSTDRVPTEVRDRARRARAALKGKPPVGEILSPTQLAEATPFYFALREFVADVRAARQARGFTLADVAEKTGLAVETLSRLETGALVNPTWQTLTKYAVAVGCRVRLSAEPE